MTNPPPADVDAIVPLPWSAVVSLLPSQAAGDSFQDIVAWANEEIVRYIAGNGGRQLTAPSCSAADSLHIGIRDTIFRGKR